MCLMRCSYLPRTLTTHLFKPRELCMSVKIDINFHIFYFYGNEQEKMGVKR